MHESEREVTAEYDPTAEQRSPRLVARRPIIVPLCVRHLSFVAGKAVHDRHSFPYNARASLV
jgi:hypothetical protein